MRSNKERFAVVLLPSNRWAHLVFRFEQSKRRRRGHVRRRWSATGWSVGFGTVAPVAPLTNLRGLSYIVQRRGGAELAGVRTSELRPVRRWDLRRCF
ncbi:MAG: hypothetical protein GY944_12635 [bacterium]|nr:hypothetical protein [bacterium]